MFKKKDIHIEYFRSSGPGGQRRNKKDTAVRITHLPTGIRAVGTESRHRSRNLKKALLRLREKINLEQRKVIPRKTTRPPRYASERRLVSKRHLSRKKFLRGKVSASED
jgi:ribosome-associated protein